MLSLQVAGHQRGKITHHLLVWEPPLIFRDGEDEEKNFGDDYLDKGNNKFEEEIDDSR